MVFSLIHILSQDKVSPRRRKRDFIRLIRIELHDAPYLGASFFNFNSRWHSGEGQTLFLTWPSVQSLCSVCECRLGNSNETSSMDDDFRSLLSCWSRRWLSVFSETDEYGNPNLPTGRLILKAWIASESLVLSDPIQR